MQKFLLLILFGFISIQLNSQTHTLKVQNGYGSGEYQQGDVIHIWAEENDQGKVFSNWIGDVNHVESKRNWHSMIIMPDKDVMVTAQFGNLPQNIATDLRNIPGANGYEVEVSLSFPPNYKAVVWLFNGKGSKGNAWHTNIEKKQWINELLLNNYAIITMDSYEVGIGIDEDGNGEFGFYYTGDTLTNKDLINVRLIKNALINDNTIKPNDKHIACGFSSGGAFSEILAAVYNWPMSISHNVEGLSYVAEISVTPHFQCNSVNDTGDEGDRNEVAFNNYLKYVDRNVCAKWILQEVQPLYAERFHRVGGVSIERSRIIFQGLKDFGALNENNLLIIPTNVIINDYEQNPANYEAIFGNLGPIQIDQVFDELKICSAIHAFNSDYNGNVLEFMEKQCNSSAHVLTVQNGYGSGIYEPGEKVHIWAGEQPNYKIFVEWQGDTDLLVTDLEWHTTLTMPDHDVNISAFIPELPIGSQMQSVNIQGAENMKRVTFYFPPKEDLKGVVWLWHGTNGFGVNWSKNYDMFSYAKYLIYHDYAVIATDCEEQTLDMDLNGDGVYRYSYGIDSTLIDQANVRALRDTFISRGFMDYKTINYTAGFSAGGAFAEFLPSIFNWRASYNQSSAGIELLSLNATKPHFHAISRNDNHPSVGAEGVLEAIEYAQNYQDREVCMELKLYDSQPLHPERFALDGSIPIEKSRAIFEEIKNSNGLNADNTLATEPNLMIAAVMNNPGQFPNVVSLDVNQRDFVIDQLGATYGYHIFKAEYNWRSLDFFEEVCDLPLSVDHNSNPINDILVYPNPTYGKVYFDDYLGPYKVFDTIGYPILEGEGDSVDLSSLAKGIYLLQIRGIIAKVVLM